MFHNYITNINGCLDIASQMMNGNLSLVYYSHIPVAIISLLIGFFVIFKNPKLFSAKILFILLIEFFLWVVFSLITWVSSSSLNIMFFWSFFGLLDSLLFMTCLYLLYSYRTNRDLPFWFKFILSILLLPIIVGISTTLNLQNFDAVYCSPTDNLYFGYVGYLKVSLILMLIFVAVLKYVKTEKKDRKEILLFSIAIALFLTSIFGTGYVADVFERYDIETYGVFAMPLFMAFLAFLIVRFKAFNIKLIGAQALVVSLIILIGSQFFFIQSNVNKILTAITLVITGAIGILLIRSVKKEVATREKIEKLADQLEKTNISLEVANEAQVTLIHFITHQVKGFFTRSKAIFAGIIEGDYGKVSDQMLAVVKEGLKSDDKGVNTVQDILNASNLKRGTVKYAMASVDLKSIVDDVSKDLKLNAEAKGLKFVSEIKEGEKFEMNGDKEQLRHIFKNLIDNAIKYTLSGEVKVSLSKEAGKILFAVKDSGVGITPADKKKLFTEGGHGEKSREVNVDSTGFGLYIVKNIVEAHGGMVWAESAGPGKGSTFFVEFKTN